MSKYPAEIVEKVARALCIRDGRFDPDSTTFLKDRYGITVRGPRWELFAPSAIDALDATPILVLLEALDHVACNSHDEMSVIIADEALAAWGTE